MLLLQALFVGSCLLAFSEANGNLIPYKEHKRHDGHRLGKYEDKHGYGGGKEMNHYGGHRNEERYGGEDSRYGMSHRSVYDHDDYKDERVRERYHHRGDRYGDSSIYDEDEDEYDGHGGRYNGNRNNENYNYVPGFVINPRQGNYVSDRPKMRDIYFGKCFYGGKVQYDCFPYTNYYDFKLNDRSYMEYDEAKPAQQYGGKGYASPSPKRPKHKKKNNNIYMRGGQQNIHRRPKVY